MGVNWEAAYAPCLWAGAICLYIGLGVTTELLP